MTTVTLSAQGSTSPIPIVYQGSGNFCPGLIVNLSNGAVMTYSVEVTGDTQISAGGNWTAITDLTGLTASANATLLGLVTAVRCTITSYTSGTLTFQVSQPPTKT